MRCLVLLTLWPLLLPPGFCLCRLETFGLRTSATARVEEPPAPRCACCKHKSPSKVLLTERPPEAPHAPSCPAHASYQVCRAVVTSLTLDDVGEFITSDVAAFAFSETLSPASDPPVFALFPSPPLYLTCRDLLC